MFEILLGIFGLVIIIFVHELGHFLVAKYFDVKVERFSIGFGKPFYSIQYGETEYCFAPFLLGGYVKMAGESAGSSGELTEAEYSELDSRALPNKPPLVRIAVAFAGAFFNFLFTVILLIIVYSVIGISSIPPVISVSDNVTVLRDSDKILSVNGNEIKSFEQFYSTLQDGIEDLNGSSKEFKLTINRFGEILNVNYTPSVTQSVDIFNRTVFVVSGDFRPYIEPKIGGVVKGSAAMNAGLKVGDVVDSVNGKTILTWEELSNEIHVSPNKTLELGVLREVQGDNKNFSSSVKKIANLTITVKPTSKVVNNETIGMLGVSVYFERIKVRLSIVDGIKAGYNKIIDMFSMWFNGLHYLLNGTIPASQMSGPISIVQVMSTTVSEGISYYLILLGYISLNIGLVNLLPLPVLDGGTILFSLFELVARRKVNPRLIEYLSIAGIVLLVTLFLFTTYNDLLRLFK